VKERNHFIFSCVMHAFVLIFFASIPFRLQNYTEIPSAPFVFEWDFMECSQNKRMHHFKGKRKRKWDKRVNHINNNRMQRNNSGRQENVNSTQVASPPKSVQASKNSIRIRQSKCFKRYYCYFESHHKPQTKTHDVLITVLSRFKTETEKIRRFCINHYQELSYLSQDIYF